MAIKLEPAARSIAAHVFERVCRESAFASPVLDAALERYPELDPRDRALATELAYGSLRTAPYVEARLSRYAQRGIEKLDPVVRAYLIIAGYQILFLDRVPAFAAVSEAVRRGRGAGKRVGAFATAILARSEEPTGDKRTTLETALKESLPLASRRLALPRRRGRVGIRSHRAPHRWVCACASAKIGRLSRAARRA
jgi:16S rRNA (cytosine967-C5)-methyltransferase